MPQSVLQGSQEQEVKFQDSVYKISGQFCPFHEVKDTENACFSVIINVIHCIRSVSQS